ncbi:RNA methyltransferase [candidate division KSB1 bacterium]|nr:RNA methyltransferase [candidate division KSB1 bacterium]
MKKLAFEELTASRPSLEEAKARHRFPVYGVVDDVRSLHNVGSIFRTADGMGLRKLYLCGITGTPPKNEIHKTALGAEENVDWEYCKSAAQIIRQLKQNGMQIVVLEHTDTSQHYQQADYKFPLCLVVGHEHFGVSEEAVALADLAIEIPMYGLKGSLNVSVAFGIAGYEIISRI